MVTVTTKRDERSCASYQDGKSKIDLLERKTPLSYSEYSKETTESGESFEKAKERMQKNLDKLLNYDRYSESGYATETETTVASATVIEEKKESSETVSLSDEDIKPTSTTLQFGDGEVDKVYSDMQRQKESQKEGYKLNGKGKLVIMLYSLAVTVILALIVLNTGVLATLQADIKAKTAVVDSKMEQMSVLTAEIDSISSNAYVIEKAEEFGMVKQ